ncbi:hypothetical protein QR680_016902 [Steinernema hermaphroditum]|uniref:Calponin-homology (CH) domain-containing protein n=1 Tax=Steinernema hermaphroditum TaxID=289476 RepID=A0AA39HEU9_9BILA|nr:hypothetical protein QR680_016902 [Steinernema hermaphroditum]
MASHVPAVEELQKERLKAESHQKWINIQLNTFTNWLNLQLSPHSDRIEDLSKDLSDGVKLIQIVESLQQKICMGKVYREDPTEIQCLMNVQMALDALREDGVRTVNIGSHDIVNGNLKLILGLVWCLVQRYQIALKSKIPPKKLMMAWLQSVLSEIRLTNFRTNWNDGRALSALLEYCQPGLCPEWRSLNSKTSFQNCERALSLAEIYLDIPAIISASDLHSTDLDELSTITYLSYFVRRNGCGYIATLERVRRLLPDLRIMDFDRSWNDGYLLRRLVEAAGGQVEEVDEMDYNVPECWPENVKKALDGALELGVASLVSADDIADPDSEYLGVMALAAALCSLQPIEETAEAAPQMTTCYRNQQLNLDLTFADGNGFRVEELEATVTGPTGNSVDLQSIEFRKARTVQGAVLSFIPKEEGHHKVQIFCQGAELPSSPIVLQVLSEQQQQQPPRLRPGGAPPESLPEIEEETEPQSGLLAPMSGADFFHGGGGQPDIGHVSFSGLSEPCSVGSIVEVVINAHGDNSRGSVLVEAVAPSGRLAMCPVVQKANSYMATFTPNEVGKWRIGILYDGEHIKGSPFACHVYDANLVQVYGLDVGLVGQELKFSIDAAAAGHGNIKVTVLRHGRQIPSTVQEQSTNPGVYRVMFTPDGAGQYKIHVLFNSMEVKGSPFILDIADASSVSVYGDNLRMASVDKLSTFMVHAPGSESKDISVTITAPSNKRKHARVVPLGDSTYKVEWKAVEAGEHAIDVRLYNQSVYESPFICNVGDPELVSVKKMPTFIDIADLFVDHSFEIDASAAGSGNLEIMINGGRVACRVKELGNRLYLAQFTPTQPITHVIEMRFNGENVRGSPWKLYTKGTSESAPSQPSQAAPSQRRTTTTSADGYFELSGSGLQRAAVEKPSHFEINGDSSSRDISVRMHAPSGTEVPVRIDEKTAGKYVCEYVVEQVGEHRLEVTIDGRPLESGPLYISAYNADKITIEPLGGGVPNQPVQFIVDAVDAGKGQLEISVNQGRVPNNVQMQGAGRCLVTFIPQHAGIYVIDVTFNGEQVQGCPIRVEILPKQVGKPVSTPFISEETKTVSSAAVVSGSTVGGTRGGTFEFRSPRTTAPYAPREATGLSPTRDAQRRTESPASPSLVEHSRQRSAEQPPETPRSPRLLRDSTPTKKIESYDPERRVPAKDREQTLGYTVAQYGDVSERSKMYEMRKERCISREEAEEGPEQKEYGSPGVERSYYESREYRSPQRPEKTTYERREEIREGPTRSVYETREETRDYGRQEPPKEKYFGQEPEKPPSREPPPPPPVNADIGMIKTSYHKYGERTTQVEGRTYDQVPPYVDSRVERSTEIDDRAPEYRTPQTDYPKYTDVSKFAERTTHVDEVPGAEHPSSAYTASTFEPGKMGNGAAPVSSAQAYQFAELAGPREHTVRTVEYSTATSTGADGVTKTTTTTREFHSGTVPHVTEFTTTRTSPATPTKARQPQQTTTITSTTVTDSSTTVSRPRFEPINTRRDDASAPLPHRPGAPALHPVASARLDEERPPRKREPSFTRTQSSADVEPPEEKALRRSRETEDVSHSLTKTDEFPAAPLPVQSQRTVEYMKVKEEDEKILDRHGYGRSTVPDRAEPLQSEPVPDISSDVVEALTPATRRRLLEHSIRKTEDLKEEERLISELNENLDQELSKSPAEAESPSSRPSSKPTTPKLSFKFKKDKEPKEPKGVDFGKSKFSSKHEVVRRGKDVEVKLENLKLGKEEQLRVIVIAPTKNKTEKGEDIIPKVKKSRHNYEISFKPSEVGTHKVMAFVGDTVHPACPFPIRVYDASEIVIGDIVRESVINDTVEFTVDAGRAGFGNLEMAIKDSDGTIIPSHVSQLETGTAKFLVTFNPSSLGMHTVNITFNKEVLKNSPFEVSIIDVPPPPPPPASQQDTVVSSPELSKKERKREEKERQKEEKERLKREKEETLKKKKASKKAALPERKTAVNKIPSLSRVQTPAHLLISVAGDEPLDVLVSDSLKEELPIHVSEEEPGVKKIEFTPTRVGDHEIVVKYAGAEVNGSPFTCRAYDPAKILVGPIPNGVVEKPVHFVVDAREAGVGNLEVAVNEGRIPSMAHALGQHKYDISFVPREFQDHTISVRFNNEPVPGSPFLCRIVSAVEITASGPGLERVAVGAPTDFGIQLNDDKGVQPVVTVQDSHGEFLQTVVRQDPADPTRYNVVYTPVAVGNLNIEVEYDGEPITGSPFTAKAYDATCARLSNVEEALVNKPCTFTIDAAKAGAGNMEIIVSVDNRNVPNFVQAEGQAKFKVSFTPQEARPHVISVKFNGHPIPGSPMVVDVAGPGQQLSKVSEMLQQRETSPTGDVRLIGDISKAQVGHAKGFSIDTAGRMADCNVVVTAPNGDPVEVTMERVRTDFDVEFVPSLPGVYLIDIFVDGRSISREPFELFAVERVEPDLSGVPPVAVLRKRCNFEVNLGQSGLKTADVKVEILDEKGEEVPVQYHVKEAKCVVAASFQHCGPHSFDLFVFGVKNAEECQITVIDKAPESAIVLVEPFQKQLLGHTTVFDMDVAAGAEGVMAVEILDPQRNSVPVALSHKSGSLFSAEWVPKVEGDHTVSILVHTDHIRGSPFTVGVLDLSAVRMIGLKNDCVGVEQKFNVDWSSSGGSALAVKITTAKGEKVACSMKKLKHGLHVCAFTPKQVGLYLVDIFVDGLLLPECPYECQVSDMGSVRARGDALTRAQRGKTARFEVSMGNSGRGDLDVFVTDANGGPLSVRCYKQQDDSYWVEFTPESIGTHTIEVTFADVPVGGSPFKCEVVDPKKVLIKGVEEPLTYRQAANIVINRKMAGSGPLSIEVVDQNGEPLKVDTIRSPSGDENVTFLPTKLGQHKMTVKLAGFQVHGTPKTFLVEEQAKPQVYGSAVDYPVAIDQQASLIFDPKKLKGGMKIEVRGSNGERVRHTTNDRPDGTKELSFKPVDVGIYAVSVDFNNKPLPGSPYKVEVVDPAKVAVNDMNMDSDGVISVVQNQRNVIDVDATAAGPGRLRAEVRDSDGQLLFGDSGCEVESLGHGKFRVVFTPSRANVAAYKIYLYFAEQVVPSAYPIYARVQGAPVPVTHQQHIAKSEHAPSEEDDHLRVFVRGAGLSKASIEEESSFTIDCSETTNHGPVTALLAGEKVDVPVRLTRLGNGVYKATYSPLVGGHYQLHVKYDDKAVKGSPFPIEVLSPTSNADVIHVDTSTLKMGIINEDVKTLIDTRRAGPGQLSAQCMGPSQLAYCELFDHRDGTYTLSVRPSEVGKHSLSIKYSDEHVPGSPFVIPVSNPPDPSRVRVHGPGIQHGILNGFKSNFVVETRGAGAGQLTVRVRGPKGAFNVEMERDRQQDRTIHCRYAPREPGDYQVEVRWHGQHVPGSPFLVMIVDTEQELQRFLAGETPSPTPATPFIPPGWVGPPPMMPPGHFPPSPRMIPGHPPPPGMIAYGPPEVFRHHRARSQQRFTNGY